MKRSMINISSTVFGQMKQQYICLDQMGSCMSGVDLAKDYESDNIDVGVW